MNPFRIFLYLPLLASTLSAEDKTRTRLVIPTGEGATPETALIQTNGAVATPGVLDPSATKTIQTFFDALQKKQIDLAYEQLTKNTKIGEKPEEVTSLKTKTEQAIKLFGEIQGAEKLTVNAVGDHLLSATYLSLGRELPLRWRFYFYKSGDVWKLIDLRVDDRLMDLFGETVPPADTRPTNWPKQ